ncbi:NmrA-like family protein [Colletotrichum kahawae]|uniref:NmrA-like family protein n=1 Tax=Colletotrichum kahawae TaxID=34407 RepID=A0AAD9YBA1_COLKA|nr:NmrA-like family protein [Colletotrichum kahawae]
MPNKPKTQASGNIGRGVLPQLLQSDLELTILSREGSAATFPKEAKVVKSDFSEVSLVEALIGQDAVISMLPIVALGEQQKVAEAAIKAGVKRFIPSEYGSDSSSDLVVEAVPFFHPKKAQLDWLASQEYCISWTAIITGPFFDWGLELGMTGFDLTNRIATLVDGGNTRFTTSTVAQIGRAIISVLKHPSETRNQLVFVESFTTTQREVLNALEKSTGKDWKVKEETSENVRIDGFKRLGEGDIVGGGASVIMALVLGSEALEDHTNVKGGMWNERLGLEKESVQDVVRDVLKQ